ncbi:MAG TPA: hypothetical protein VJO34_03190 [Methylomirabilota bacterium]|nr:hypothetical protein [Methylomirabilota bacterium]
MTQQLGRTILQKTAKTAEGATRGALVDGVMQKVVIYTLATLLAVGLGYSHFKGDSIPKIQAFERVEMH